MGLLETSVDFQSNRNKSGFFNSLVEKEFSEYVNYSDIHDNFITLKQSYSYQNKFELEFGMYFINTSEKNIKIATIPLVLELNGKRIKKCNYNFNNIINKKSAGFVELIISKKDIGLSDINVKDIVIKIDRLSDVYIDNYVTFDTTNLIDTKYYADTKDIRKFIKKLPTLKEGMLAIDCYHIDYVNDNLEIVLILRNSSDEGICIKSLPINVSDQRNLLLCRKNYILDNFTIKEKGIKIAMISIPKDEIVITDSEYSKYKVEFVN